MENKNFRITIECLNEDEYKNGLCEDEKKIYEKLETIEANVVFIATESKQLCQVSAPPVDTFSALENAKELTEKLHERHPELKLMELLKEKLFDKKSEE